MTERMTEQKLAALEAAFRAAERDDELTRERAATLDSPGMARLVAGMGGKELAEKRQAFLEARAQLERERREDADAATTKMVEANHRMADASEAAARSSAEAAQASKMSARYTLAAALVALLAVALQAWQAWNSNPQPARSVTAASPGRE